MSDIAMYNIIKIWNADKPHTWGVFHVTGGKCISEHDTRERAEQEADARQTTAFLDHLEAQS